MRHSLQSFSLQTLQNCKHFLLLGASGKPSDESHRVVETEPFSVNCRQGWSFVCFYRIKQTVFYAIKQVLLFFIHFPLQTEKNGYYCFLHEM